MNGLPTLDEFLEWTWPRNSYVDYPGFTSLYLRSTDCIVWMDGKTYRCTGLLQIGNVAAEIPGNGTFTRLVEDLAARGFAIFVENVHNIRFRGKLVKLGFIPVNQTSGVHFLGNHDGHLTLIPLKGICADRI